MAISSNLGFPRIGPNRELKKALEKYWAGKVDERTLQETCRAVRRQAWHYQQDAGIQHIPSNDFSIMISKAMKCIMRTSHRSTFIK